MPSQRVWDGLPVECDICHRPVAQLVHRQDGFGDRVILDGPRVAGGDDGYWRSVIQGPRGRRYAAQRHGPLAGRLGGFIVPAPRDPFDTETNREKLVCTGRKHNRYERVVTSASVTATYHRAMASGQTRVGMRDIRVN